MDYLSSSIFSKPMGKVFVGIIIAAGIIFSIKEGFAFGQWLRIH